MLTEVETTTHPSQALQEQMIALVRAFGLHRPGQTPCGQPVGVAEAHTLLVLTHMQPLTQQELCGQLRLEKSTVSRLVAQLEQRGWLERSPDPTDGRVRRLRLTLAGGQAADDLAVARHATFARVFDAIPVEQREPVLAALGVLVEAMRERS
jgi:DNA-binding MarR family transcriptional regulator